MRDDATQGTNPNDLPDDDGRDATIERAVASLGALPPANPAATARILAAVAARRAGARRGDDVDDVTVVVRPATREPIAHDRVPARLVPPVPPFAPVDLDAERRKRRERRGVHRFTVRALAGVGLAAAVGGFMVRGVVSPTGLRMADAPPAADVAAPVAAGTESAGTPGLVPVAADARTRRMMEESVLHEVPFMLAAPDARRVSVVGDFNGWDATATPLARDRSGVWTALVAMPAGRHSYAFLVDDSVLTLDPRAPRATDPDLGTQHSVLLVGAP